MHPLTAAANWFLRRRGRAMGLVGMSVALGSSVLALSAQLILERHGWRAVFVVFAVLVLTLAAPAALVLRHRPEDIGLLPDGGELPLDAAPEGREHGAGP